MRQCAAEVASSRASLGRAFAFAIPVRSRRGLFHVVALQSGRRLARARRNAQPARVALRKRNDRLGAP